MRMRELTPAQDFKDRVAYTTVTVKEFLENKVIERVELITSEGKRFPLTPENLFLLGFYSKREPFPIHRWSEDGIETFLSKKKPSADIREVFAQVKNQFEIYLDFADPGYYSLLTLWTLGTYFHRRFSSYPYLHLAGDMSTGKTKTLTLISLLAFNGEIIFNSTPSYLIRIIHNNHATLCIDEAENLKGKDGVFLSMLNSGYKKGIFTGKIERENGLLKPERFEGFSPKVFASINGLYRSLASRCIRVQMVETSKPEIKNREVNIENQIFQDIRDNLYTLMFTQFLKIKKCYSILTDEEIQGRDWELFSPIFALAKMIENKEAGVYNDIRRLAIGQIKERKEEKREDMASRFIVHLKEIIDAYPLKTNFYPTVYLLQSLKNKPGFETIEGKFIVSQLRNLGLVSNGSILKKVAGRATRGYCLNPEAQNAFGATVKVQHFGGFLLVIAVNNRDEVFSKKIRFPLSSGEARISEPNIEVLFICKPRIPEEVPDTFPPLTVSDYFHKEPTFSESSEGVFLIGGIRVKVVEVWIYNIQTGKIYFKQKF